MEQISITWAEIVGVAGGIVLLGNLGKMIISWTSPYKSLVSRIKGCEEKLANDHARLNREEEDTRMILQCLFTILQHQRTGNDTGLMDKTLQSLQLHLANRK